MRTLSSRVSQRDGGEPPQRLSSSALRHRDWDTLGTRRVARGLSVPLYRLGSGGPPRRWAPACNNAPHTAPGRGLLRVCSGGLLAPPPVISLRSGPLFQGAYPLFDLAQLLPLTLLLQRP